MKDPIAVPDYRALNPKRTLALRDAIVDEIRREAANEVRLPGARMKSAGASPWPRRLAAMSAAAAVVAGLLVVSMISSPSIAGAGVGFETRGDFLVARATDTSVGAEAMTAAFQERGLDVQVDLTATSPSLEGLVAGVGYEKGDWDGVEVLEEGRCFLGERLDGCDVGLLIPRDFSGSMHVIFGRPAQPGEAYDIQGDVFAKGEDLHCHAGAVLNGSPTEAIRAAEAAGVSIDWWKVIAGDTRKPDPLEGVRATEVTPEIAEGRYVTAVWALSDGHVAMLLSSEPNAIRSPEYLRFVNQGCERSDA